MTENFGQRLRRLRTASGLSQDGLAKQCGITGNAVSQWESHRRVPSSEFVVACASAVGVSLNYLLTGREGEKPPFVRSPLALLFSSDDAFATLMDSEIVILERKLTAAKAMRAIRAGMSLIGE